MILSYELLNYGNDKEETMTNLKEENENNSRKSSSTLNGKSVGETNLNFKKLFFNQNADTLNKEEDVLKFVESSVGVGEDVVGSNFHSILFHDSQHHITDASNNSFSVDLNEQVLFEINSDESFNYKDKPEKYAFEHDKENEAKPKEVNEEGKIKKNIKCNMNQTKTGDLNETNTINTQNTNNNKQNYVVNTCPQNYQLQQQSMGNIVQSNYLNDNNNQTNILQTKNNMMNFNTPSKQSKSSIKQYVISNFPSFSEDELIKYSLILVKNQKACMFLQEKVNNNKLFAKNLYISIKDKIVDLMYGGFSNYFVQKLIENLPLKYIEEILNQIISSESFTILGLDPHGTRVLQKILESIVQSQQTLSIFTDILMKNIQKFIFNPNANHIIIKYASCVPYPNNQIIFDYLAKNIIPLSHKKNSCCAFQKCIEVANVEQKEKLFDLIGKNAKYLIVDDFGNYVLQFIIPHCSSSVMEMIVDSFIDNINELSIQKSSSNVIEKCIIHTVPEIKEKIIKNVTNQESIDNLIVDKYGNYVLQTIIMNCEQPYLSQIEQYVMNYQHKIDNINSKKLYDKIIKLLTQKIPKVNNSNYLYKQPIDKKIANTNTYPIKQIYLNGMLYERNQKHNQHQMQMTPMNINIAINNYYSNPVYNYFCFQNQQHMKQGNYNGNVNTGFPQGRFMYNNNTNNC
jgi:hypothetical protein